MTLGVQSFAAYDIAMSIVPNDRSIGSTPLVANTFFGRNQSVRVACDERHSFFLPEDLCMAVMMHSTVSSDLPLLSAAHVFPFHLSQQQWYISETSSKELHRYRYKRPRPIMIVVDSK